MRQEIIWQDGSRRWPFFWFVIAVLLQRRELIEQRKQFEKTTIAQEEQARSLQRSKEELRRQIGVLTEQYQADTILRTWSVGRELQLKALGEPSLAHLLPGPKDTAFIGIIINHYAELFELHRLNPLTETGWDSFQRDMAAFFGNPSIREIWRSLMPYHNDEFVKFVQEELLVRCGAGGTEEGRKGQEDDAN